MEVNLNKKELALHKKLATTPEQLPIDIDVVIPDYKPDALRILKIVSNLSINSATPSNGAVLLDGNIYFDIIYLTEEGKIAGLKAEQNLNHTIYFPENAIFQDADVFMYSADGLVINSRKLGVRAVLSLSSKGYMEVKQEVTTDIEGEYEKSFNSLEYKTKNKIIEQKIAVRENAPSTGTGEILYATGKIVNTKEKIAGTKVLIKGDLELSYAELKDDSINMSAKTIPFSEIVSLYGIDVASENILSDTFSIYNDLEVSFDEFTAPEKVYKDIVEIEANGQLQISDFENLVNWSTNSVITNATADNGSLSLSGVLKVDLLYKTSTNYDSQKIKIPFDKKLSVTNNGKVYASCENIDVVTEYLSSGILDIKAEIEVKVRIYKEIAKKYVSSVVENEAEKANKPYKLRVYYAKQNDTAWNIAKKFKIRENDIEDSDFSEGKKVVLQG